MIGSVHDVVASKRKHYSINTSKKAWLKAAKEIGGKELLIKKYYQHIREMANSRLFDCVGHIDVIKNFNSHSSLFSERTSWYHKEACKTLDEIAKVNMCIEINTSGWRRKCQSAYPSHWILTEAHTRKIPITIGSDTHTEDTMISGLERAVSMAKEVGYKKIQKFKKRKMIDVKI